MEFFLTLLLVFSPFTFGNKALDFQAKNPGCDPVIHICENQG
jgi:hypothetical protein